MDEIEPIRPIGGVRRVRPLRLPDPRRAGLQRMARRLATQPPAPAAPPDPAPPLEERPSLGSHLDAQA